MELILISAIAKNRVIGKNGGLPWKIPEDSKRFQKLTINHPVIYGSKTWEFDLKRKPLKNRLNIVLSHSYVSWHDLGLSVATHNDLVLNAYLNKNVYDCLFVKTVEEAVEMASFLCDLYSLPQKTYVAGGAMVYESFLPLATGLELTILDKEYEGDTYFPDYVKLLSNFTLSNYDPREGYGFYTYARV